MEQSDNKSSDNFCKYCGHRLTIKNCIEYCQNLKCKGIKKCSKMQK